MKIYELCDDILKTIEIEVKYKKREEGYKKQRKLVNNFFKWVKESWDESDDDGEYLDKFCLKLSDAKMGDMVYHLVKNQNNIFLNR